MGGRLLQLGYLGVLRALLVVGDALVECFRDFLAVGFVPQFLLVGRTADKRDLGENGRHGRAGQYRKGGVLDAAVADAGVSCGQRCIKRALDTGRQTARLFDLRLQAARRQRRRHRRENAAVFTLLEFLRSGRGKEVRVVGFNAPRSGRIAVISEEVKPVESIPSRSRRNQKGGDLNG